MMKKTMILLGLIISLNVAAEDGIPEAQIIDQDDSQLTCTQERSAACISKCESQDDSNCIALCQENAKHECLQAGE